MQQNYTRGSDITDVQPLTTDSWFWKSTIQVLNEFQHCFHETGEGVDLNWDEFVNNQGKLNCGVVYDIFRTKGVQKSWGDLL